MSHPRLTEYWGQHGRGLPSSFSSYYGRLRNSAGVAIFYTNTTASFNTGVGAGTLALSNADENTATGAGALLLNTTGAANTATEPCHYFLIQQEPITPVLVTAHLSTHHRQLQHRVRCAGWVQSDHREFNIDIGNLGVAGDSNAIRIGDLAAHDTVFLAGIVPMNPEAPNQAVLVDPSTGQLGMASVGSFPPGPQVLLVLLDPPDRQAVLLVLPSYRSYWSHRTARTDGSNRPNRTHRSDRRNWINRGTGPTGPTDLPVFGGSL